MAEPSNETDQSMEDILQSIKRIIADEGDVAPASSGSDVLELTDLLAEDAAPPPVPAPEPVPAPAAPKSAQDDIDALFNAPAPEPEVVPVPPPEPVVAAAPEPAPAPAQPAIATEQLISDTTLAASSAALQALTQLPHPPAGHNSHAFRSGSTVEDLVIEALKPMLKDWLDGHLPDLVRTLVEREIRRVSGA